MIIITKIPFSELLDISCFLSSQKLRGTLTTAFERHKILRTWINVRVNWINMMKQKWAKVPWKLLVAQKSELVL